MSRVLLLALLLIVTALLPARPAAAQGDVFSSGDGGASAKQACLQGCNMKTIPSCSARDYVTCRADTTACRNKCYGKIEGGVATTRQPRSGSTGANLTADCDAQCTQTFAACEGGVACNYDLEKCIHQCRCEVDPDCGPAPTHRETDDGGTGGGAKGITRTECHDAAAKGILRPGCEKVLRADCADPGAKGISRTGCGELHKRDCLEAGAKGIFRADCDDLPEKQPATCEELAGPDPVVGVPQLIAAMDRCLVEDSSADWYVSPQVLVSPGATAFHDEGSRTITHDPAALEAMSLYDRSFTLAYAYAAYFLDLESQRLGTARSLDERSGFLHEIAGFLAHCVERRGLYPKQVSQCPDARAAHRAFLESGSRGLTRTGSADPRSTAHGEWTHGWNSYGAGLPGELRHEPTRDVIEAAQGALARLGYDPGPVDGLMGARTAAAVMAFERAHGLEPTGVLHQKVLHLLAAEEP